jgi:hypothetical protein
VRGRRGRSTPPCAAGALVALAGDAANRPPGAAGGAIRMVDRAGRGKSSTRRRGRRHPDG